MLFCFWYYSWYKKQLDNKREHSGTEQMSSNLKAQLERVIKKKFKFSNDDDDDDEEKEDFAILSICVSFSISFLSCVGFLVRLDILFLSLNRKIGV